MWKSLYLQELPLQHHVKKQKLTCCNATLTIIWTRPLSALSPAVQLHDYKNVKFLWEKLYTSHKTGIIMEINSNWMLR